MRKSLKSDTDNNKYMPAIADNVLNKYVNPDTSNKRLLRFNAKKHIDKKSISFTEGLNLLFDFIAHNNETVTTNINVITGLDNLIPQSGLVEPENNIISHAAAYSRNRTSFLLLAVQSLRISESDDK